MSKSCCALDDGLGESKTAALMAAHTKNGAAVKLKMTTPLIPMSEHGSYARALRRRWCNSYTEKTSAMPLHKPMLYKALKPPQGADPCPSERRRLRPHEVLRQAGQAKPFSLAVRQLLKDQRASFKPC